LWGSGLEVRRWRLLDQAFGISAPPYGQADALVVA
jgi:hypothetical protein